MNPPVPGVYCPHAQSPGRTMWVTVRTSGDPAKLAGAARGILHELDRDIPILQVRHRRGAGGRPFSFGAPFDDVVLLDRFLRCLHSRWQLIA